MAMKLSITMNTHPAHKISLMRFSLCKKLVFKCY